MATAYHLWCIVAAQEAPSLYRYATCHVSTTVNAPPTHNAAGTRNYGVISILGVGITSVVRLTGTVRLMVRITPYIYYTAFNSYKSVMATQTSATYASIREGRYEDAVRHLNLQRQSFPRSKAALSLLGFCYYHLQDFRSSAQSYEELVMICPDVEECV